MNWICVENRLQYYPWLLTWDMEALLVNLEDENSMWKAKYSPISVCITSNVSGFEGTNFISDPNFDNFLKVGWLVVLGLTAL